MDNQLYFKIAKPEKRLADFVESFWVLENRSNTGREMVIIPDGRIDLILSQSPTAPFHISLSGIETHPARTTLASNTLMFAISFKLPAIEYVFHNPVSTLLNYAEYLPLDFWNFNVHDLTDFKAFCKKASEKILSLLPEEVDSRKQKLFELIYSKGGSISVKELSQKVYWSSRQINRFFNQQYGLSLKAYCTILRFRASLDHIAQGDVFPQSDFTDQSHFIKDVKRFSGVTPKELVKNKNGRFIQLSVLPGK